MRKRPEKAARPTSPYDVHDIRSLTATGRITLPFTPASVRKPATTESESAPAS